MVKLRDYQQAAVNSTLKFLYEKQGNPLVALPTATGKSLCVSGICGELVRLNPGFKIINLVHTKELVEQNYKAFCRMYPHISAGIYSAGLDRKDIYESVIFAGIASVAKKPELFGKVNLITIDEAHAVDISGNSMYLQTFKKLHNINPSLRFVGFTATPFRLGQGYIHGEGKLFSDLAFDATSMKAFNWFIDQGYLTELIPKRTGMELDVSQVRVTAGDFNQRDLQAAVDKEEITRRAVDEMVLYGHNRHKWIIFTTGIEHTIHTAKMLNDRGIKTTFVHSNNKEYKMSDRQRDQNIIDFKEGKYQAMVNANVLIAGFDSPEIDLIADLAPTKSHGRYIQKAGRGMRVVYAPGYDLTTPEGRLMAIKMGTKPNCLYLDFARNRQALGPINDPWIAERKKGKTVAEAPVKTCEQCQTICHPSVRNCPTCGYEFIFQVKFKGDASRSEIIKRNEHQQTGTFKVDRIVCALHTNRNTGKNCVKLTYHCANRMFNKFLHPDPLGPVRKEFADWWRLHSDMHYKKFFQMVDNMGGRIDRPGYIVEIFDGLRRPSSIDVLFDADKYPQVIGYHFEENN